MWIAALLFGVALAMLGLRAAIHWRTAIRQRCDRDAQLIASQAAEIAMLRGSDAGIVQHLPDPLLLLDTERRVVRSNPAAQRAFGADTPALLRHPSLRDALDRAMAGCPQQVDISIAGSVARDVLATIIHMDRPLADGGVLLLVLSDRTRDRALDRMRADFVANASHELRTPLASLVGFIETLQGPARDDPAAQKRFLDIMAAQAARMARLIDDLLTLSRVEIAEHRAPTAQVDLAQLIATALPGFESLLAEHQIALQTDLDANASPVQGDADQLMQVLQNLLDNGIKYGRQGGMLRIALSVQDRGAHLAVADDGVGIPRHHIPRLTERFYRVDAGRSRAVGGTGLGLAIVKHIVNRHRGRLQIISQEGKGTTVSVWLPFASH